MRHLYEVHVILNENQKDYPINSIIQSITDFQDWDLVLIDYNKNYIRLLAKPVSEEEEQSLIVLTPENSSVEVAWALKLNIDSASYDNLVVEDIDKPSYSGTWYEISLVRKDTDNIELTTTFWKLLALKQEPDVKILYRLEDIRFAIHASHVKHIDILLNNGVDVFSKIRESNIEFEIAVALDGNRDYLKTKVDSTKYIRPEKTLGYKVSFIHPSRYCNVVWELSEYFKKQVNTHAQVYLHKRVSNKYELSLFCCDIRHVLQALESSSLRLYYEDENFDWKSKCSLEIKEYLLDNPKLYMYNSYYVKGRFSVYFQIPIEENEEHSVPSLVPELATVPNVFNLNLITTNKTAFLSFTFNSDFQTVYNILKQKRLFCNPYRFSIIDKVANRRDRQIQIQLCEDHAFEVYNCLVSLMTSKFGYCNKGEVFLKYNILHIEIVKYNSEQIEDIIEIIKRIYHAMGIMKPIHMNSVYKIMNGENVITMENFIQFLRRGYFPPFFVENN